MKRIVFRFRNDLRLLDQPILNQLQNREDVQLLPIFCFDEKWFVEHKLGFPKTGSIRTKFLIETVNNLKSNLQQIGSDLFITFGRTEDILSDIAQMLNADEIHAAKEDTSEELFVEVALTKRLSVPVYFHESTTLLRIDQLPFSINTLLDVFTYFRKRVEPLLYVVESTKAPERLPRFPDEFRSTDIVIANPDKVGMKHPVTNVPHLHLVTYCDLEAMSYDKRTTSS